jgi:hypothetical protein
MIARMLLVSVALVLLAGCATVAPKDYTEFRKSNPRSILVLPPINESVEVAATYSVLTTTTRPLAELGYYVFPVAVVDAMLKENGLTIPGEMHQAPLAKLHEVFGADAVLYIVVEKYGSKYQVIASTTMVHARAKLVDARTGVVLWEGRARAQSGGQSGLIEAVVTQVMSKMFDQSHGVAAMASHQLVSAPQGGLLRGPRHPAQFGN